MAHEALTMSSVKVSNSVFLMKCGRADERRTGDWCNIETPFLDPKFPGATGDRRRTRFLHTLLQGCGWATVGSGTWYPIEHACIEIVRSCGH